MKVSSMLHTGPNERQVELVGGVVMISHAREDTHTPAK